jgi:hypothetical protein
MDSLNKIWDAVCKYNIDGTVFVLGCAVCALIIIIWRFQKAEDNTFNIIDLVMENGKASKIGCAWVGSFLATTWVILHLTLRGSLTEGYFQAYLVAWVAPLVAYVIWGKKPTFPIPEIKPPGAP